MDYLGIVINGYFDKNNRSFLLEYFFSEYKKAEKEHYGASRFFEGCLGVIEPWELYIKSKVFDRVNELHIVIEAAKSGRLSFADLGGKTIEQKTIEAIKHYEQELENVRQDGGGDTTFTAHLASLTNGRIFYNISYPEILQIKKAIMLAREKAITPDPLPPEQTETKTEH